MAIFLLQKTKKTDKKVNSNKIDFIFVNFLDKMDKKRKDDIQEIREGTENLRNKIRETRGQIADEKKETNRLIKKLDEALKRKENNIL